VTETGALGYATPRIDYPKRLKVKQKTRVFSPEEEVALLNHLASSPRLRESYDLAVFLLATGARNNEALTTTWDDANLEGRRLRIIRHKTKTQTILGISNRLHAVLERRFQEDTSRPGNNLPVQEGRCVRASAVLGCGDQAGVYRHRDQPTGERCAVG
jgi:integrase